jgi:hypothetical protein
MAKEIQFSMWVSIIPDRLYASWIKNKFIPKTTICDFVATDSLNDHGKIFYRFDKRTGDLEKPDYKWVSSVEDRKILRKAGYKNTRKQMAVSTTKYELMKDAVSIWYETVFDYVELWLKKHGYLNLKQGKIQSGFCTEPSADSETAKNWGAPVAAEGNKVSQMKEKFGRITVYFDGLTESERKKIKAFERAVEKKFDCVACFS